MVLNMIVAVILENFALSKKYGPIPSPGLNPSPSHNPSPSPSPDRALARALTFALPPALTLPRSLDYKLNPTYYLLLTTDY